MKNLELLTSHLKYPISMLRHTVSPGVEVEVWFLAQSQSPKYCKPGIGVAQRNKDSASLVESHLQTS